MIINNEKNKITQNKVTLPVLLWNFFVNYFVVNIKIIYKINSKYVTYSDQVKFSLGKLNLS